MKTAFEFNQEHALIESLVLLNYILKKIGGEITYIHI